MTNHVCQLIEVVAKNLSKPEEEKMVVESPEDVTDEALMKKLAGEWREFFSVSASDNLLRLWLKIAGKKYKSDKSVHAFVILCR